MGDKVNACNGCGGGGGGVGGGGHSQFLVSLSCFYHDQPVGESESPPISQSVCQPCQIVFFAYQADAERGKVHECMNRQDPVKESRACDCACAGACACCKT